MGCGWLQSVAEYWSLPSWSASLSSRAAVHNGPSYPECGQIVPALLSTTQYSATRHYQADIIPLHYRSCHWSSCHTQLIRPRSDFYWQMVDNWWSYIHILTTILSWCLQSIGRIDRIEEFCDLIHLKPNRRKYVFVDIFVEVPPRSIPSCCHTDTWLVTD